MLFQERGNFGGTKERLRSYYIETSGVTYDVCGVIYDVYIVGGIYESAR